MIDIDITQEPNIRSTSIRTAVPLPGKARTIYPSLVFLRGSRLGVSIRLLDPVITIGRSVRATIRLEGDDEISRMHAQIRIEELDRKKQYILSDLNSSNGTVLNGVRLKVGQEILLSDGDKITIGHNLIRFSMLDDMDEEYCGRIRHLIRQDDLTGLLTRESFTSDLDRELARSIRHHHQFCILMMDIDFFKKVNDTYGHLVGSQVLREVSSVIKQNLRDSDIAGRYGGEEFIALLPETSRERGLEAAERIRTAIEQTFFTASLNDHSSKHRLTISIGLANYPSDCKTTADVIGNADIALYQAKQTGRNKVCLYNTELTGAKVTNQ